MRVTVFIAFTAIAVTVAHAQRPSASTPSPAAPPPAAVLAAPTSEECAKFRASLSTGVALKPAEVSRFASCVSDTVPGQGIAAALANKDMARTGAVLTCFNRFTALLC